MVGIALQVALDEALVYSQQLFFQFLKIGFHICDLLFAVAFFFREDVLHDGQVEFCNFGSYGDTSKVIYESFVGFISAEALFAFVLAMVIPVPAAIAFRPAARKIAAASLALQVASDRLSGKSGKASDHHANRA